jgi:hypothetical protein
LSSRLKLLDRSRSPGLSDSHMARDRGVSAAPHLLYIRARKVCERELARFGPLLHHLDTPAPLFLPIDPVSVSLCVARLCVRVRVCAALCAPHVVSPRDLWLCVLPRWQINVNVNVNVSLRRNMPENDERADTCTIVSSSHARGYDVGRAG